MICTLQAVSFSDRQQVDRDVRDAQGLGPTPLQTSKPSLTIMQHHLQSAVRGKARQGKARQGKARQGKARQGKARHCITVWLYALWSTPADAVLTALNMLPG